MNLHHVKTLGLNSFSDSETDAFADYYLQGFTNQVYSTMAEAINECEKLPQSQGYKVHQLNILKNLT